MVKATPTPTITDESRAVAESMAIPVSPINPKRMKTDAAIQDI